MAAFVVSGRYKIQSFVIIYLHHSFRWWLLFFMNLQSKRLLNIIIKDLTYDVQY